jgi:hypothetical protein
MTQWQDHLLPSEAKYVQDIVDQIPDIGQPAFEAILDKLASSSAARPKYRYIIASTIAGDVTGTNDREKARAATVVEEDFVIDVSTNTWLIGTEDDEDDTIITEAR